MNFHYRKTTVNYLSRILTYFTITFNIRILLKDIHKWIFSIKAYLIYDNVCSYDTFTYLCYSVVSYISNLTDNEFPDSINRFSSMCKTTRLRVTIYIYQYRSSISGLLLGCIISDTREINFPIVKFPLFSS